MSEQQRSDMARTNPPGSMRIWLVVAAVGAVICAALWLTDAHVETYLFGIAPLIVGVGGALWEAATKADRR